MLLNDPIRFDSNFKKKSRQNLEIAYKNLINMAN